MTFYNPDSAVNYIKVAFVHSRFDYQLTDAAAGAGLGTYPSQSNMLYSSSYVFTEVTTLNTAVSITAGVITSVTGTDLNFNRRYYHLPDTRYAIYGLTNFEFPTSTSCTNIKIDATLNSIDLFTISTLNTGVTNLFFVADIFTKNIDALCQPAAGTLLASQVLTVGEKRYFTIPTESSNQYIIEESVGAPVTLPFTITPGSAFTFQYYATQIAGNTETITMRAEVPFNGLTSGAPIKFVFGYFDDVAPIDGGASTGMADGTVFTFTL